MTVPKREIIHGPCQSYHIPCEAHHCRLRKQGWGGKVKFADTQSRMSTTTVSNRPMIVDRCQLTQVSKSSPLPCPRTTMERWSLVREEPNPHGYPHKTPGLLCSRTMPLLVAPASRIDDRRVYDSPLAHSSISVLNIGGHDQQNNPPSSTLGFGIRSFKS